VLQILIAKIRQISTEIPPEVKRFIVKGAMLLAGWSLLYGFLIKPYDLIDPELTRYTGATTVWFMQYLYQGQHLSVIYTTHAALLSIDNKEVLYICDPCNALDLYVLFTGFILCVPMGTKKMISYILIGMSGIFLLNVIRCLALIYLYYHHFGYTDIAHHYFFQLIVYAAIFILWERYFRSVKVSHETAQV